MIARFGFLSLLFLSVQGFVKPTPPSTFVSKSAIHAADEVAEVKVGDTLPDVVLMQGQEDYGPPVEVKLSELVAGKKVAIFGVPGAFTPGCSKSHLPSFIEAQDALKDKDVELTICVATNDAFVMEAWGSSSGGADAGIMFLSDAEGELTKQLGLILDKPVMMRMKRFSLIADDGVVTHFFSADEAASNTFAPAVLEAL